MQLKGTQIVYFQTAAVSSSHHQALQGLGWQRRGQRRSPAPDRAVSGGAAPGKQLEAATATLAGREPSQKPLPTSLPHHHSFLGIYLLPRYPIPLPLTEHLGRCRAPGAGPSFGQTHAGPGGPAGERGGTDPHGSGSPHGYPGFPHGSPGSPHRFPGQPAGGGAESALPVSAGRGRGRGRGDRPCGTRGLRHRPQGRCGSRSAPRLTGGPPHVTWAWARASPGGFVCDTATAMPRHPRPVSRAGGIRRPGVKKRWREGG